ncbi:unnamed protein product, partial [Symbiodinium sp. CCMP2592]
GPLSLLCTDRVLALQTELLRYDVWQDGRGWLHSANASRRSVLSSRVRGELERYLAASGSLKLWGHICYLSVLVTLNEVLYRIVCDEITDDDVARVNGNVAFVWDS